MGSITKQVATEILPFLRVYTDGSIERLSGSPFVPPQPDQDPETHVSSKDIKISSNPSISARIYLPKLTSPDQKLPVLVYYHGGGFVIESAFSSDHHHFLNGLVSQSNVVAVSVEYRLAPEHFLPIAYEDCWEALQWVSSYCCADQNPENDDKEPWLVNHANFHRVFLGGDSAGANIVHNMLIRAGKEKLNNGVKILGALMTHPYFWGSKQIGSESSEEREKDLAWVIWNFVYPKAVNGVDNYMINPLSSDAPCLDGLGCERIFVSVAELDELKNRGVYYYDAVKKSGYKGEIEFLEVKEEGHAFQVLNFGSENAKALTKRMVEFLLK